MEMRGERAKRQLRYCVVVALFLLLFAALVLMNIQLGSVRLGTREIADILFFGGGSETGRGIIWKVRLPRACAAVILGGALALSGFLLQTFFNNPIAGPYVLGISSGAKLTVAIFMVAALSRYQTVSSASMIAVAFVGAMLSMGFVLLMARTVQRASMLIVSGVMIGYICSAITDFIVTFADDASIINLHNWSKGSFSGASWEDVRVMTAVVLITSAVVFLMSKPIGAYQLGEGYAQNMGVNIRVFRVVLVVLSSVLSACVTAFAGPISFVGIAVPHLVKSFLKTSKPLIVIPVCFLGGAIFCLGCDLIARTVFAPMELSISSVTAVIGAPIVIGILLRKKVRG
ncbi:MAG: iron ABC transporter permease [Clostridiales bacterium]|uniref:FecCD family ABC transporter permease n=1 Tax=Provencibacterium massiliense TaxID=1841868 RepID=UPI0009A819F1|nr:iron ABC transporter permease [Provencibacterium massiliense]PWM36209.1 MAG: iron ABC transporter permease [Clostridiales bacterium]RGB69635.1 iron ABC transporter permease [Harryflintia acetispora]